MARDGHKAKFHIGQLVWVKLPPDMAGAYPLEEGIGNIKVCNAMAASRGVGWYVVKLMTKGGEVIAHESMIARAKKDGLFVSVILENEETP